MDNFSNNCNHIWGPIHWDKKIKRIPYGSRVVTQGVDRWEMPEGYNEEEVRCQVTICTKCGKKKYLD